MQLQTFLPLIIRKTRPIYYHVILPLVAVRKLVEVERRLIKADEEDMNGTTGRVLGFDISVQEELDVMNVVNRLNRRVPRHHREVFQYVNPPVVDTYSSVTLQD